MSGYIVIPIRHEKSIRTKPLPLCPASRSGSIRSRSQRAIAALTGQMQTELDLVWDKLLPAFRPDALPADAAEQEKLKQTVSNLTAHPLTKKAD